MAGILHWKRLLIVLSVLALVAAACGDDDDVTPTAAPVTAAPATAAPATDAPADDMTCVDAADALTVGTLLPVTGDLAFLGPPEVAGARLAEQDINAAGGVLCQDIVLHEGDSGDTSIDIANPEVDRLLALGVHAIFGAASSAVSKTVIDKITGNNVIQFSPANTSDDFTNYDDGGFYFRTAPPDVLQGKVIADELAAEGSEIVAILYRQESYGTGLAESVKRNFEALGGTVDPFTAYAVDTENFDAEVDAMVAAAPDAIVVIGFVESANILTTMHERGVGPTSGVSVWGVDGNIGGIGKELSDPSILVGMQGTAPSVDLGTIVPFTDRLDGAYQDGVGGVFDYGAETYDAIIIVALAAQAAGSTDPTAISAEINDVTRGGTKCTTYGDCKALLEDGTDIDYDGIGGPYDFVDAGEPAAASFRISTYDGGETPNSALDRYVFAAA
jgi:neutral amino acid transport system substrate-binding protein